MLECLIVGDSIGVGLSKAVSECQSLAVGGLNTYQWNRRFADANLNKNYVIISLGTNDHKYVKTKKELQTLRNKITQGRVAWIMPNDNLKASEVDINVIRGYIQDIAQEHQDVLINIDYVSPDRLHPTVKGYQTLAQKTRDWMTPPK